MLSCSRLAHSVTLWTATCCYQSVNSLNALRQGACAVLDILKLLLRGVWTGRRTCWSGCGRKSGIVCCFFLKTNTYLKPICMPSTWEMYLCGRETVDSHWQCTGCRGSTAVKRCNDSVFKLIEIWKKQKFFSHHFYFWAVRIYCRFLQGPGKIWERVWTNISVNCAFQKYITSNF